MKKRGGMTYKERQFDFNIKPISNFKKKMMKYFKRFDDLFTDKEWRNYCSPIALPSVRSEAFDYHLELRNKERCKCCRGLGFTEKQSIESVKEPNK